MSDNYERTTVRTTSEPDRVVIRRGGSTGWWVAALVAIVAIVAVIFMYVNSGGPTQADLQAARDQGATEANIANASASAQQAASVAAQAAQDAAAGAARATEHAAQSAASASQAAASSAADAAEDATTSEPPR
jgi:hypothetical protein